MEIPINFEIEVFGQLTPFSETISRARAKIFYRGLTRNRTYITDEFAEKLLFSLPYTPVKGIYSNTEQDYGTHGDSRDEGRIYGIAPENPNVEYEKHVDADGIEREYACADVLIYTGLYNEAEEIIGKSLSMELYLPSIKGKWESIGNEKIFFYTDACFLGLQVLGDTVEPCFEGAAFFSMYKDLKQLLKEINGGEKMKEVLFKLADHEKHDQLFDLLNPNYTENWEVENYIIAVYDEYAVIYNREEKSYYRQYYTKTEDDMVTLGDKVKCFIVDVTEEENRALKAIQAVNGNTFAKIDELYTAAESKIETLTTDLEEKTEAYTVLETNLGNKETELAEQVEKYTTLETTYNTAVSESEATIGELNNKITDLENYKKQVENSEKEQVLQKFEKIVDAAVIQEYKDNLNTYTVEDIKQQLAYKAFESNPSIFGQDDQGLIPVGNTVPRKKTGAEQVLDKYRLPK